MCIRNHVFIVVHAPEIGARGQVHYLELDQFVGENFLVTVHGPISPKVPLEAALREADMVAEIAREVGLMEQRVMAEEDEEAPGVLRELFAARHELLTIKTMAEQGSEIDRRGDQTG